MGSKTKEMRANEEAIKRMIVAGHRRGVMDSEGNTIKNKDGRPVAKPRATGLVTFHKVYPRSAI